MLDTVQRPALSVYELTLLFDDHPTAELVIAICEQVQPERNRHLLFAMYGIPVDGAIPDRFVDRLTRRQSELLDLGLLRWRVQERRTTTPAS